jgi:hypothetical protein
MRQAEKNLLSDHVSACLRSNNSFNPTPRQDDKFLLISCYIYLLTAITSNVHLLRILDCHRHRVAA